MTPSRRAGCPPPTSHKPQLKLMLISASFMLALMVHAPDSFGMTVTEAVNQGLAVHPKVASVEAELNAATTDIAIARDGYFPNVQASVGPENSLWGDIGWNVTASQMLFDWGRVKARVNEASARERELYHRLKLTSEEAALEIAEVYLDVLLFEARIEAADRYISRLTTLSEMTSDRSQGGFSDRSEAERARLELARANEQRSIEYGSLLQARANFRELIGAPPLSLIWPQGLDWDFKRYSPEAFAPELTDAPSYQQAQAQVEVAEASRAESKAALKPRLNLEGSLMRRNIGGHMETDSVVSLTLRMDAMQGLSSWRRVDAAMSREQAARWNQLAAERDLRRELNDYAELNDVVTWRQRSLEEQLINVRDVAEAYQEQFEIGHRGIDDLLPIQRELFEAERLREELRSQSLRMQYRSARQLGHLGKLLNDRNQGGDQDAR